jgi:hypothetical protein
MSPRLLGKLKILVLVAMVALVPLRALAAVTTGICPDHTKGMHGPDITAHHHHGAALADGDASSHDGASTLSVCSLCTACCSGASFAAEAPASVVFADAHRELIPFYERRPASPHPDQLDRPPLSR